MNKIKQFLIFCRYLVNTFYDDRCLRSAAALTYTTLLSLVPLSTVIFSVFSAFPMFESFSGQIQSFIFENFVPTSGEAIQSHIEEFASKTSKLTAIGAGFLILSALLMMNTIEGALNDIWHIKIIRKPVAKFMVYWAMLTLGPILIGVSLALSSYLTSLPMFSDTGIIIDIKTKLLGILPFLATMLACTLLYAVVPNTQVPLRYAFSGAVVAAILFELAKKGFALYVTAFPTYEMIYGALATIPVFLVWLYLSWLVVMLGAEVSYCLQHKQAKTIDLRENSSYMMLDDFKVLGKIWHAQQDSNFLCEDDIQRDNFFSELDVQASLERLQYNKLAHQTIDGGWALSKDSTKLTLADLYLAQSITTIDISAEISLQDAWAENLDNALRISNKKVNDALNIYLQPLYQKLLTQSETKSFDLPTQEMQRREPTIKL